jgi:hypothetical protein
MKRAIGVGAIPISKQALGVPRLPGSSPYTNPISAFGYKAFPRGARLPVRVLGTTRAFGVVGRLNPYVGAALLAYDAYQIGSCVSSS